MDNEKRITKIYVICFVLALIYSKNSVSEIKNLYRESVRRTGSVMNYKSDLQQNRRTIRIVYYLDEWKKYIYNMTKVVQAGKLNFEMGLKRCIITFVGQNFIFERLNEFLAAFQF